MNDPYLDEGDLPPRPDRSRAYMVGGIAVVALAAFGGLIWYAYNLGSGQSGAVPTITAQTGPVRREPADRGGEKVEHTDKDVYNVLERQAAVANKPRVERLLPPPEAPMARPPEPPAVTVGAAPPPPPAAVPQPPAPGLNPPPPIPQQQAGNVPPPQQQQAANAPPTGSPNAARPGTPPAPATPPAARPGDRPVAAAPLPSVPAPATSPGRPGDRAVAAAPLPPPGASGGPPGLSQPPRPPAAAQSAPLPAPGAPPATPPANREVASLPPPGAEPKPESKPPAAQTKPPPAAAQPTPKPGTGPVRVQFGAYKTEDEAKNTWAKLRSTNGDLLGRLAFMTESVQRADGTVLHRVQGGTLSDAAAAQFLCDQMKARKVDCIVVKR